MKLVTEYLERAVNLERLSEAETNPVFKEQLLEQAKAYHALAEKRAAEMNIPLPRRRSFDGQAQH
jgi:hypothetical protein